MVKELRALCKKKGVSFVQFEQESGIGIHTANRWDTSSPSLKKVQMAAAYFGITVSELLGETEKAPGTEPEAVEIAKAYSALDERGKAMIRAMLAAAQASMPQPEPKPVKVIKVEPPKKRIPLLGQRMAAGRGEPPGPLEQEDYEVAADSPAEFAVHISGNSMEPYLHDGTIALCKKRDPVDGDIAVLMVDGFFLVKQVCEDSFGNLHLLSLNRDRSDADDHIMHDSDREVKCYGTVIVSKPIPLVKP